MPKKSVKSIREIDIRETPLKSKDYENSVNRYASWAYQETFLVFMMNFLGFTVDLKKNKEGNTHRFARIQKIYYQIDNVTLQNIMIDNQQNENNSTISNTQNCQNNTFERANGNDALNTNQSDVTESHSIATENNAVSNEFMNNNNVKIDEKTNSVHFVLFEDTEYFESICSSQQKRLNGSKNINDFAKMCSLFLMYFFNTFGIQFKIKGEGKTFPMITEIHYNNEVITNAIIQDVGKRHFSEMVRGNQLTPETVLMKERENDENVYNVICSFFMSIQQAVYSNVKEYLLFIQFISHKFFNLYCNDDRESVMKMLEERDEAWSPKNF